MFFYLLKLTEGEESEIHKILAQGQWVEKFPLRGNILHYIIPEADVDILLF